MSKKVYLESKIKNIKQKIDFINNSDKTKLSDINELDKLKTMLDEYTKKLN
jgi:hypothetical protein